MIPAPRPARARRLYNINIIIVIDTLSGALTAAAAAAEKETMRK